MLNRAQQLFHDKIKAFTTTDPGVQRNIEKLVEEFQDRVVIRPEKDSDTYGAARLAAAIIEVAQEQPYSSLVLMKPAVLRAYEAAAGSIHKSPVRDAAAEKAHMASNFALVHEINDQSVRATEDNTFTIMDVDEEGNPFERVIVTDQIDLLEEFDLDDMTVEGLRKVGAIDADFDTTSGDEYEMREVQYKLPEGQVVSDGRGSWKVVCPCGSDQIYAIAWDTFGCFVCEKEFATPMTLHDRPT